MVSSKCTNPPALPTSVQEITLCSGASTRSYYLMLLWVRSPGVVWRVFYGRAPHKASPEVLARAVVSSEAQVRKAPLPSSHGCWRNLVLMNNRTKSVSFLLGWTQPLALCHLGIGNMAASLFKASKQERLQEIQKLQPHVTSSQKWHHISSAVLLVRSNLRSFPHTRQADFVRMWIPGVQNIRRQHGP